MNEFLKCKEAFGSKSLKGNLGENPGDGRRLHYKGWLV